MASQNLSPRQKMINMMYLVLTAMLALNVSAEILEAFESLRDSLERSAGNFSRANDFNATQIIKQVEKELSVQDSSHFYMLAMIQDIRQESAKVLGKIALMADTLETIAGKDPITGEITRKDEKNDNYRFWLGDDDRAKGGAGNGSATQLREQLNGYVSWANHFHQKLDKESTDDKWEPLAMNPLEDNAVQEGEAKGQSWEYRTFHDKPVIADLALLEKFKMDVLQIESELIGDLFRDLAPEFAINKLGGMYASVSDIVPAGTYYEARIFPVLSSDNLKPEFVGPGLSIDPNNPSIAKIKIPASAGVIQAGSTDGIQRWQALIKVPKSNGDWDTIPISGQFTVRKPEIVVESNVVQSMYKDCGNSITVDVPALGDNYNPDFTGSSGGTLIPSRESKKKLLVVPNRPKFKLTVSSNTNGQNIKIGEKMYDVLIPPLPKIALFIGNDRNEYEGIRPVPKRSNVTIRVLPDPQFKDRMPRDARYKVNTVRLMYQDGFLAPPETVKIIDCSNVDIMRGLEVSLYTDKIRQATDGNKFYLEIDKVYRVNFRDELIEMPLGRSDRLKGGTLKQ